MFRLLLRRSLLALIFVVSLAGLLRGGPIRFEFTVPPVAEIANPFARELWAEVTTPSGRTLLLPAFYVGQQAYAVHARPDEIGTYRLGNILESSRGRPATPLATAPRSASTFENKTRLRLPPIRLDPNFTTGFARADGRLFLPFGANVAWAQGPDVVGYYRETFAAFAAANLNWMRVWMCHWGRTNLDWVIPEEGAAVPPGGIAPAVAARWDQLLADAEQHGVYLQIVLQHHGQFSTTVNPNWADHPWNAAQPRGFLKSPADFFTDPTARLLTALKYRYIVARWSWSPAVFAWELFNEVHWVDALKLDRNEAAVARWHDDMAKFIRSVDAYAHPITTSTEDLRSPIYASMDFLQPHLYSAHLLPAARTFAPRLPDEKRPVFYGEFGDDHVRVSAEVKKAGLVEPPVIWASLMGESQIAAQIWEGWKFRDAGRLSEIGAAHRFVALSGWARHADLQPFSARVECATTVPLTLPGTQHWQRRPVAELTLPLDGREQLELGDWPKIFATPRSTAEDGFPHRGVFRADFPHDTRLRLTISSVAEKGGALRVFVDGKLATEGAWRVSDTFPVHLTIPVAAGLRTVTVENTDATDWVEVSEIDLGLSAPVLAAIGRRNDRYIALWVRHRANLHSLTPDSPAAGTVLLEDVPAGTWTVTWWDTREGKAAPATKIEHAGGTLHLPTPPIERHAAVALVRQP